MAILVDLDSLTADDLRHIVAAKAARERDAQFSTPPFYEPTGRPADTATTDELERRVRYAELIDNTITAAREMAQGKSVFGGSYDWTLQEVADSLTPVAMAQGLSDEDAVDAVAAGLRQAQLGVAA